MAVVADRSVDVGVGQTTLAVESGVSFFENMLGGLPQEVIEYLTFAETAPSTSMTPAGLPFMLYHSFDYQGPVASHITHMMLVPMVCCEEYTLGMSFGNSPNTAVAFFQSQDGIPEVLGSRFVLMCKSHAGAGGYLLESNKLSNGWLLLTRNGRTHDGGGENVFVLVDDKETTQLVMTSAEVMGCKFCHYRQKLCTCPQSLQKRAPFIPDLWLQKPQKLTWLDFYSFFSKYMVFQRRKLVSTYVACGGKLVMVNQSTVLATLWTESRATVLQHRRNDYLQHVISQRVIREGSSQMKLACGTQSDPLVAPAKKPAAATGTFACDFCEKVFKRKHDRKRHLASEHDIHNGTGVAVNVCDICGDRFTRKSDVNRHKRSVHDNVGFVCAKCNRKFSQKTHYINHMNEMHLGMYGFPCRQCETVFDLQSRLERHLRTVHQPEVVHTCTECGQSYRRRGTLKRHVREQHGGKDIGKPLETEALTPSSGNSTFSSSSTLALRETH
mmetsp:Transcript_9276/g.27919  ORF Transcript_9276/g.27919 Transcript_9276/m.27919 type:complete len:498 (+) Transcript_9276:38-1531(+)|eukprot:CAMPEP_0198730068 /NCGR_PEP_ID=MMETSP1475-20131203/22707_1 /TAXON_ID= ORGANISM="Unidentified sp., Strain CCMP1999" /NCGR_SAMPLE_ID=MMETSP1475 /ASSEMBLY_ACC=CAM_ASM_001111 /LENGTH=497 /DNA_ID=CAMNT_0044492829 /DNA_START=26 /DNA_END=1519 /DNA_ORIENTATION=-